MLFAFLEIMYGWVLEILEFKLSLLELFVELHSLDELIGLPLYSIRIFSPSLLKETLQLIFLFMFGQTY